METWSGVTLRNYNLTGRKVVRVSYTSNQMTLYEYRLTNHEIKPTNSVCENDSTKVTIHVE